MKTENMKLLDLQTGKYLEFGEGFYYGGDHIVVNKCNVGYQIYEAIQHKDSERLSIDNKDCPFAAEPPLPLKEICEKVGAVVYGGRYVLINEIFYIEGVEHKYSDVFRFYINKKGDYMVDYRAINCQALNCKFDKDNKIIKLGNTKIIKIEYIGNPFEEYSKQLRNEPSKFDELKELLK